MAPTTEAEAPRVDNINTKVEITNLRVKTPTPRVEKLPKKQHFPPKNPSRDRKTKYGYQHQPHKYQTQARSNMGVEYTGVPTPKQHTAYHICTLTNDDIKID